MREIFKRKKGKDFYRDSLEYFEYDPEAAYDADVDEEWLYQEHEEIAHRIATRIQSIMQ